LLQQALGTRDNSRNSAQSGARGDLLALALLYLDGGERQ
jgi:hypothetical protein